MKILVATEKPFAPVAIRQIMELAGKEGHTIILFENYTQHSELVAAVTEADAMIVRSDKVTADVISAAKNMKVVVRAGAGYDNIDLAACTANGIIVMNTPGQNSNAVAELAFEMMLYDARSGFSGKSGSELRGKTLGLQAFGNVGKYMAMIGKGFGMDVHAFDPFVDEQVFSAAGVTSCKSAGELYSGCHYVSLHMPFNEKTSKSIGYDLLKMLRENAVLINTARKEIIDEEGLVKIFNERKDIRYLSDGEPDCKSVFEEKFRGRYIFTAKKMGAQTEEANTNAGVAAVRQIADYFRTGNQKFRVNK